jgi:hypothetical protein
VSVKQFGRRDQPHPGGCLRVIWGRAITRWASIFWIHVSESCFLGKSAQVSDVPADGLGQHHIMDASSPVHAQAGSGGRDIMGREAKDSRIVQAAFVAGGTGKWKVERLEAIRGPPLATASRLEVSIGPNTTPQHAAWILRGVTSHEQYATRAEHDRLSAVQPPLDRARATRAALIPIAKSAEWWELPQDERRAIFEEDSHHIAIGLEYLPAIARRLYHSRDLGEPFDFLTWFEYSPADAPRFEELVTALRRTREWDYVEREVDIRLAR